mgnify:CR=1 FL=1
MKTDVLYVSPRGPDVYGVSEADLRAVEVVAGVELVAVGDGASAEGRTARGQHRADLGGLEDAEPFFKLQPAETAEQYHGGAWAAATGVAGVGDRGRIGAGVADRHAGRAADRAEEIQIWTDIDGKVRGRKRGPENLSVTEMKDMGMICVGSFCKHKYVMHL